MSELKESETYSANNSADYILPAIDILPNPVSEKEDIFDNNLDAIKELIDDTLRSYGIHIESFKITAGPTITLFEITPAIGSRISNVYNHQEDITWYLKGINARILAPSYNKGPVIAIEVPNKMPQKVSLKSVLSSIAYKEGKYQLPIPLGVTVNNETSIIDLADLGNLLISGASGQGKSVLVNAIISSLLFQKRPDEIKFVLIDPKIVELGIYNRLPSQFFATVEDEEASVITDIETANLTLSSLCEEMDKRYSLLYEAKAKNIKDYNEKYTKGLISSEENHEYLPSIIVIIEEFADLIMTLGKDIEHNIVRLATLARPAGIHMIITTQRPSTNVITPIIKANINGHIAFKLSSGYDSQTILGIPDAALLAGNGDMLYQNTDELMRLQGPNVDMEDIEAILEYVESQNQSSAPYCLPLPKSETETTGMIPDWRDARDCLFEDAARFICAAGHIASTSSLQKFFDIDFHRACRIMKELEEAGVVGPECIVHKVLFDIDHLESLLEDDE